MLTVDEILATAGAALGRALTAPVDLGGSPRSTVLRCQTADGPVVVKTYHDRPDARASFPNDAAALALGAGPDLLAADGSSRTLVMEDLGSGWTVADLLLDDDPNAARAGLVTWATTLGRLAADSANRRDEFNDLRVQYGAAPKAGASIPDRISEAHARLPEALAAVGVPKAAGFDEELSRLLDNDFLAFSPGDTCPDNNLMTPTGLRLLDFENSGYRSVFLDAAYCRVPFPTCWCAFRLPAKVAEETERAYRSQILHGFPELADDSRWNLGVESAVVAWGLASTAMIPTVMDRDYARHPGRHSPTMRQVLRHRWDILAASTALPAIADTARRLLLATDGWGTTPLAGHPAFGDEAEA